MYLVLGEEVTISDCKIDEEFNGVNHKTSHDGVFRIVATEISQEVLDNIRGVKVTFAGSYSTFGGK